jgi:hypothetical protein
MKTKLFALLFVLLATTSPARAAEPTAFALAKEGNRHIGEEAKDRVVEIRSEKSVGTLVPNIWHVTYFDPDAAAKSVTIKFAAGQKVSVKRTARIIQPITGAHKELPKTKLKIDSDKALDIAKSEPLLKNLTLKASRMDLERRSVDDDMPVWKIELWAAKLNNPNKAVSVGEVFISAEDGKVVKNDLKISRVD